MAAAGGECIIHPRRRKTSEEVFALVTKVGSTTSPSEIEFKKVRIRIYLCSVKGTAGI
jgi:hypothetical protein